jgi:hypothetical protein
MTQRHTSRSVEVRHSRVHGDGVFARRTIAAGSWIGDYAGRRYQPGEEHGTADADAHERGVTYVFGLSDGSLIDGAEGGNATRHINHCCVPNCVAWEVEDDSGQLRVEIEALRRIAAGEELFLDYGLDPGGQDPGDYACLCGTPACRGTLLGPVP